MPNGKIARVNSERGFGFITGDDGKEYFFHRSSVSDFDSLTGGESVTFDAEQGDKGPRAAQVKLVAGEAEA